MFFQRLAVASALLLLSSGGDGGVALAQELASVGDSVCIEGYIMDSFCIDLGVLFDNSNLVTLDNPDRHSIHCLVDVPDCVASGYEVLVDPLLDGDTTHCRSYRLDDAGDVLVRAKAQARGLASSSGGSCTSCVNEQSDAMVRGYRAAVIGTVTSLGDATTPADLAVTEVRQMTRGCPGGSTLTLPPISNACRVLAEGETTTTSTTTTATTTITTTSTAGAEAAPPAEALNFPLSRDLSDNLKMEWGLKSDALSVKLTYQGEGWIAIAASNNAKMADSDAVVGVPGVGVSKYFLDGFRPEERAAAAQTLLDASITQANGVTTMIFTKALEEDGELSIDPNDTEMYFLFAMGTDNNFAWHGAGNRGFVQMSLAAEPAPVVVLPTLGVSVDDEICVEGYVMDRFCINRGTLFDNQDLVTLDNPDQHSFHCLLDVPQCVATPYEILIDPLDGDTTHCRGFQLDMKDSATLRTLGQETGLKGFCSSCTGTDAGSPERGFRATVRGRVVSPGDFENPPTIELISVEDSSVGCGGGDDDKLGLSAAACADENRFEIPEPEAVVVAPKLPVGVSVDDEICVEGYVMDTFCINRGTLFDNANVITLEGPDRHSYHCLVDVAQCVATPYEILIDPLDGDTTHCRGFQLDMEGSAAVRDKARLLGKKGTCSSCTGEEGQGERGFRATVRGRVTSPGDFETPPTIELISVDASSVGCGGEGDDDAAGMRFGLSSAQCLDSEIYEIPDPDAPTASPPGGGSGAGVDCATEYQFTQQLSDKLTVEFTVHREDDAVPESARFRARLTYAGEGWLAYGFSPDGRMAGSTAVIGMPGQDDSLSGKHQLAGYDRASVGLLEDDRQTLTEYSLEQADGKTVLTFAKLLQEEGEVPINVGGETQFIWAHGDSDAFGYHGFGNRGVQPLTVPLCVNGQAGAIMEGVAVLPDERPWRSHGIMALTGWGFLTPIAIASSWCRDIIGAPTWFKIHALFNSLTFLLSIALFAVAIATYNKNGQQHFQGGGGDSSHQRMGLAMFIMVCIQVIGGFARPHVPAAPADVDTPDTPQDAAEAAENGTANEEEATPPEKQQAPQKSKVRIFWEFMHKLSGEALLGMSMFQINKGLELYEARGYDVFITQTAYWAWVGSFLGFAFVLAVGHKFFAKNKEGDGEEGGSDKK